jgi:hypothetical protein
LGGEKQTGLGVGNGGKGGRRRRLRDEGIVSGREDETGV